jgi:hypothetical protein
VTATAEHHQVHRPEHHQVHRLLAELPQGRERPIGARRLASMLGVPTREIGYLISGAIDAGYLIGSSCTPGRSGYFRIVDEQDLRVGTAHIRARAAESFRRVRALEKAAARQFGPEVLTLFDEAVAS